MDIASSSSRRCCCFYWYGFINQLVQPKKIKKKKGKKNQQQQVFSISHTLSKSRVYLCERVYETQTSKQQQQSPILPNSPVSQDLKQHNTHSISYIYTSA